MQTNADPVTRANSRADATGATGATAPLAHAIDEPITHPAAVIHPHGWRAKHPLLSVVALAPTVVALVGNIGCYLLMIWLLDTLNPDSNAQHADWQVTTACILIGLQALWLTWVRTRPLSTAAASLVLWALAIIVGGSEPLLVQPGVFFAMFVFAREHRGALRTIVMIAASLGAAAVLVFTADRFAESGDPVWHHPALIVAASGAALVTVALPALLGAWYSRLHRTSARIATIAREAIASEPARTAEAVAAERRILASELHDAATAHLASVLALSTTAEQSSPPESAKKFGEIRSEGQELYGSIEAIISRLKQPDRTLTGSVKPRSGQHSITEVDSLVADHQRRCGTAFDYFHDPELEEIDHRLGPMRSHIAYRVVQEALSNVRKHADGAEVQLSLEDDSSGLWIWIENTEPSAGEGNSPDADASQKVSLGYGIDGMRDRLAAAGGSLRTGPRHDGGWSVKVHLPHPQHRDAGDTQNRRPNWEDR